MDPGAKRLFKGPKGPLGPLGPERSDFFKGPKGPLGPLGPPVAHEIWYLEHGAAGRRPQVHPQRVVLARGGQSSFSVLNQGSLGAFGPLKKVASLRDPCPESPKMVGYTFDFMPGRTKNGRRSRPFWEVLGMK